MTPTDPNERTLRKARTKAAAGLTAALLSVAPQAARAQDLPPQPSNAQEVATYFKFEDRVLQQAPSHFKLQARISQAKLPVGDAEFSTIQVKVKSGASALCSESFSNVKVRDSVLNLEIGRGMRCGSYGSFAEAVAAEANIKFQVCIGAGENCLSEIDVSSVPFAVKASYAGQAQVATEANTAAQCNYAHRVTADRDLFVTQKVGEGYYDFHTPTALDGLGINPVSNAGGFIQWTPVDATHNTLHLCGKDGARDEVIRLARLVFHADVTDVRGDSVVRGTSWAPSTMRVGMSPETSTQTFSEQLVVQGESRLVGATHVDGALNANAGANVTGELEVDGSAQVTGDVDATGTARAAHLVAGADPGLTQHALYVSGSSHTTGTAYAGAGLDVTGNAQFRDPVAFEEALTVDGETTFSQRVNFDGDVYFGERVVLPDSFVLNSTESANIVALDDIVVGAASTPDSNGSCSDGATNVSGQCLWQTGPNDYAARPVEFKRSGDAFFSGNVTTVGSGAFSSLMCDGPVSATSVTASGDGSFGSVTTSGEGSFGSVSASGDGSFGSVTTTGEGSFGTISAGGLALTGLATLADAQAVAVTASTLTSTGAGTFGSVSTGTLNATGAVTADGVGTFGSLSTKGALDAGPTTVNGSLSASSASVSGRTTTGSLTVSGAAALGYRRIATGLGAGRHQYADISCGSGERVVGGGVYSSSGQNTLIGSYPVSDTTWRADIEVASGKTASVFAICMRVQ